MSLVTDFIEDVRKAEEAGIEVSPFERGMYVGRSIAGSDDDYEDIAVINRALAGINVYPLGNLDNKSWI